ncbi:MAG: NADH-quinone oxidoreductase subunit L [Aestuariibacter sp.]
MLQFLWLVPTFPFISALLLALFGGTFSKKLIALFGAGSVALAAITTALIFTEFDPHTPVTLLLWQWLPMGNESSSDFSLYLDGLSMLMMSVVTGVGALIHWYAAAYMQEDKDFRRFFVYMNLFVAAMLMLVLADNLVLLYLGWEGVGLCSFLLVGFWHDKSANAMAAKKAFVVTRVGDTAMLIGLLILFMQHQELAIQPLMDKVAFGDAQLTWLACVLLLLGAAGKSAQFPLHTWLPDAMAGPTPVSALIHAATMVTAGVYLIARLHPLFLTSPEAMYLVAATGAITLLISGLAALGQMDFKRVLAYSTISQIGYMFLSLGAGGWNPAVFHLMTHAFFKALLFLTAGSIILKCHHHQNLNDIRGCLRQMPVSATLLVIGLIALAALPGTAGFFSKEAILEQVYVSSTAGPVLWYGAMFGALITAMYSARLLLLLWYPKAQQQELSDFSLSSHFVLPLLVLAALALVGGWWPLEINSVFAPVQQSDLYPAWAHYLALATPWLGFILAWWLFGPKGVGHGEGLLHKWLYHGLGFDWLYERLFVKPYEWLAHHNKADLFDAPITLIARTTELLHEMSTLSQNGKIRWYAAGITVGCVLLIGVQIWI